MPAQVPQVGRPERTHSNRGSHWAAEDEQVALFTNQAIMSHPGPHHASALGDEGDGRTLAAWKHEAVAFCQLRSGSNLDRPAAQPGESCNVLPEGTLERQHADGYL